jgi:serine/threonine-protein kinase HipA
MVEVAKIYIWDTYVGAVRWDNKEQLGYFEYAPQFLKVGWELSPIKMPISRGNLVYSFPELRKGRLESEDTFKGLPGLLADALPDKFGNRLIDAWLTKQSRPLHSMNPVERLCFIGSRGMGALQFEPAQFPDSTSGNEIELNELVVLAKNILEERESFTTNLNLDQESALSAILRIGTSAGGARPKAVIAFNPNTGEVRSGQGNVPESFEHWLIKLDGVSGVQFGSTSGWGRVEYAYYLMALGCGINMSFCKLFEENGRAHFMTKRFDRDGNIRHHTQTFCGIQHFDFNDMFSYSYEQLFETMRILRLDYSDAEELFRRMVFNVIATNFDDHTKNFSFLLEKDKKWKLSPAYDLCFSYNPNNVWVSQQTLSIKGKRNHITRDDMLSLASEMNIKNAKEIIQQVNENVKEWDKFALIAKVESDLKKNIKKHLQVF